MHDPRPVLVADLRTLAASIRIYRPPAALAPFLVDLYVAGFDRATVGAVTYRRLPETNSHVLFVRDHGDGEPRLLHCGVHASLLHSSLVDRARLVVAATLVPFAAALVLGRPVVESPERFADLPELLGDDACRLRDELAEDDDADRCALALSAWIGRRALAAPENAPATRLCHLLGRQAAPVGHPGLRARLGLGDRQLHRLFVESTGLAPKRFLRIERFRRALELTLDQARPEWTDIALTAGYCDQSHLIQEFREFVGEAPNRLVRRIIDPAAARRGALMEAVR